MPRLKQIKKNLFTENKSKSACLIITLILISQYNYFVFNKITYF